MKNRGLLPLLGGVVAAVAASSCCILPLLLGAASAGSVGLGAAMAPYRPYFMALTVLLLGGAFYFTYRPRKAGCETDCCGTNAGRSQRVHRALLWVVTLFTVGALAYPNIAAYRVRNAAKAALPVAVAATASTAVFAVGNMTCAECTLPIVKALKATPGVYDAAVDFSAKRATVRYDASKISGPELRKVIEKTGFPVMGAKEAAGGGKMEAKNTTRSLVILSDEAPLKVAFNQAKDSTRLLLLVSPT
jgi:mercuric ion transport protein